MRRTPSFRRRLFAGFLAASLIPLLACSAMMLQIFRLRMASEAEREMAEHLTAAAAALDAAIDTFSQAAARLQNGTVAARALADLPPITVYEPTYVERPPEVDLSEPMEIRREDDGTWIVEGPALQRLMANVNFGDYESRNWFDRMLRQCGLFDRLEEQGIRDGDTVSLYNLEFEYQR